MTCKWNWQMFACETLKLDLDNSWKFVRSDVQLRAGFAFGLALQAKLLFFFFWLATRALKIRVLKATNTRWKEKLLALGIFSKHRSCLWALAPVSNFPLIMVIMCNFLFACRTKVGCVRNVKRTEHLWVLSWLRLEFNLLLGVNVQLTNSTVPYCVTFSSHPLNIWTKENDETACFCSWLYWVIFLLIIHVYTFFWKTLVRTAEQYCPWVCCMTSLHQTCHI